MARARTVPPPPDAFPEVDGRAGRRLLAPVRARAADLARAGEIAILRGRQPAPGDLTAGVLRDRRAT